MSSGSETKSNATPPSGRVGRILHWLLGGAAATLLFSMMALTFLDVLGRYFLNAPVPGGFEITELMLATLIFAALPLVTLSGEQITVDLFDALIPASVQHLRDAAINFVSALMLFVLSTSMWEKAGEMLNYGDTTAILLIPIYPLVYFMSVMLAFTATVLLGMSWWVLSGHDQPRKATP